MNRREWKILKQKILYVLIHSIGDTRVCPHCQKTFIPNDTTANNATANDDTADDYAADDASKRYNSVRCHSER